MVVGERANVSTACVATMNKCIVCCKTVQRNQHAVTCDQCDSCYGTGTSL